jgi:hypothetical protein
LETKRHLVIIVFSLVLFFGSCYNENNVQEAKPDNFLTEQQMAGLMTDVQIAEGALAYSRVKHRTVKKLKEPYYNQIFLRHNISPQDFIDNLNYYNSMPEVMERIIDEVLENLNQIQAQVEIEIKAQAVADSLAKIQSDSLKLRQPLPDN